MRRVEPVPRDRPGKMLDYTSVRESPKSIAVDVRLGPPEAEASTVPRSLVPRSLLRVLPNEIGPEGDEGAHGRLSFSQPLAPERQGFSNPIARGADPWVVQHAGLYYHCEPVTDNSIAIWKTDCFTRRGRRRVVWKAPRQGWNSHLIWAPELHRLDGRWYIYYAASAAPRDNPSHRIGVLECVTDDPQGPYLDRGQIYTGDDPRCRRANCWAIDATVLELRSGRYLLWSGWPAEADRQYLYIAPLANPWTTAGPRVRLCDNATYAWERVNDDPRQRGLHEAPQVLKHAGRVFVIFSCSASWQQTYKLGLLEFAGDDPLDPAHWRKHPQPVFQSSDEVFGVGHASFVKSPDGSEDWLVYHSKTSRVPGWRRVVCAQRFGWRADGLPDFGQPASWHRPLDLPSGAVRAGLVLDEFEEGAGPHAGRPRCLRLQAANAVRPDLAGVRYAWRFGQCPCEASVSFAGTTGSHDCRLCRAASTGA